jgi:hypothetical protein
MDGHSATQQGRRMAFENSGVTASTINEALTNY